MSILTKHAILAAGLTVWREGGQDKVTIPAIAGKLGKTHSAIYHYYKSAEALREDLIIEAIRMSDPVIVPQLITSRHPSVGGMSPSSKRRFLSAVTD